MKKTTGMILALGMLSATYGAVTIDLVGDGTGYDLLGNGAGNEAHAYRSTGVAKTFDVDGDDAYGTEGLMVFGDGGAEINNQLFTKRTQVGAGWATFAQGANFISVAQGYGQGPMDNPTNAISADVADWGTVGAMVSAATGGAGTWGEMVTFTFDAGAPQQFRIGLFAGTQAQSNGRWDPTGLRISSGGVTNAVTGLENNTPYGAPNWVFFDIDLNGETSGTFTIEGQKRLATQGPSLAGITFDTVVAAPGASLALNPASLSLDLYAPDTSVDGAITATYMAGAVTSNDITIVSALAGAGFSASITDPILGNSDTEEEITVTFDNTGIGLANGESTNSTLVVVWSEAGSGVSNTSSVPLSVTYINEPNSFELTPASLSLTLNSPDTSTNGTIVASYIEGTIPANIEIVSVVVTNGFSVDPASFVLGAGNTDEDILVTYTNTGALVNHGDTADSVVVVTWTQAGSGVTNTANGSVDVFYYSPTISTTVIAGYDFDDGTGTATTNVTVQDANVTASGFGVGTGIVSVVNVDNGNSYYSELDAEYNLFGTANGFEFGGASSALGYTLMNNADNLPLAITNADYMVFTVTPTNGYAMDLISFTFRSRVNQLASSAERWALFSSVGGFANGAEIATGQTTDIQTWDGDSCRNVVDLSAAEFKELDGAVEFRLYIYGGSDGFSSATLFDKVIVNGDVYGLALPPISGVTVSDGALIMSWDDGRAYNVLTNVNLAYGEWGVSETGVSSPVTNAIGSESQLFYKLGK
ncbi:hypothetical protein PDESU_01770 [Pontiella desulfatans]|uniref:Uncharacterized protein n=1 Tax=Pontiella desulfatans TaxID=2750659 RepID=A0A6C2U1G0_PONDE|nr:hypothetical protein [Pontiella desulfatans]VGO13216.1 hypothetical protein PDESU_01770 [Pontiella desulfatans]